MEKCTPVKAASLVYQAVTADVQDKNLANEILTNVIRLASLDNSPEVRQKISQSTEKYSHGYTQQLLATINEQSPTRKKHGVYYTPQDLVEFVLANSVATYYRIPIGPLAQNAMSNKIPAEDFAYHFRVLDPTSGLSEFLISTLRAKIYRLIESGIRPDEISISKLIETIRGNDINSNSIAISRIRLYLEISALLGNRQANAATPSLLQSFTSVDFIGSKIGGEHQYELILGNPPYVEDRKYGITENGYGNVYCNVLSNASKLLTPNGTIGFVIPLSYCSTPRMSRIRAELLSRLPQQTIMSFADRPDSLFSRVHQKLCVLIATNSTKPAIHTSHYQYWYKDERPQLFENIDLTINRFASEEQIPKLGTPVDISIFTKLENLKTPTIYEVSRSGNHVVSINRRETFWMKAFRGSRHHPEFKEFYFTSENDAALLYCILNSSLFWWYWITVSDCWHVSRSLNGFKMPEGANTRNFTSLAERLEAKLEQTKKRVYTRQTEYEYKHAECLDIIHEIDQAINELYALSASESDYIMRFAIEYRTGRKVNHNA